MMKTKIIAVFFSLSFFAMAALPGQCRSPEEPGSHPEKKVNTRAERKTGEVMDKELCKAVARPDQTATYAALPGNKPHHTHQYGPVATGCGNYYYLVNNNEVEMGLPISTHYKVTEWFAPGFGIVKTVNYNKKGKVAGHAELTGIKQ